MSLLTIITPTYNRCNILVSLYESLERQTNKNFEWLIVDDGSQDGTTQWVEQTIPAASFSISYIKQKNGGKHAALNTGIREISSLLTIIVDSDDSLLPNAVELICQYYAKYKNETDIAAFSFLKCHVDGVPVIRLDKEEYVDSYIKCRIRENRPGDMAEVFYTAVLKEFPFPVIEGERFLSEDVVWIQIGLHYKFVFINQAIYRCEYLAEGLTANDKPLKFASPQGSMLRGKMLMKKECGIKANIKGAIIYNCYNLEVKNVLADILKLTTRESVFTTLTKPFGRLYYRKWKKRCI